MNIKIDELAETIQKEMQSYSDHIVDATKKTADSVAKETVDELKNTSPRRTGDYAKGWTTTTSYENQRTKRNTVHNRRHYQLTHLLENGHAKRGGGRVAPRVHIAPVEQKAIKKLEDGIRKAAENAP